MYKWRKWKIIEPKQKLDVKAPPPLLHWEHPPVFTLRSSTLL